MNNRFKSNKITIAVIADVHFGQDQTNSPRRCGIADVLLERAVRRLNRLIRPDAVLVLGDLVDDGNAPGAEDRLQTLRASLDKLECPYLAIPGNHDGDSEQFYRVFSRPKPVEDIGGARFLAFVDQEEPRFNASRSKADIDRIRRAGENYDGPLITLQHVCLFPTRYDDIAPYNYTNAPEVIAALKDAGVTLSVSGHHHHGGEDIEEDGVTYVNAPGLCESPFPFLTITVGADEIHTQRHELAMPRDLELRDNHIHTELAYCAENMSVDRTIALAHEFGLAGITFTEHSGQLYFDRKPYWSKTWLDAGIDGADPQYNRMSAYLQLKRTHEDNYAQFSLEVDCDARGDLVLRPEDRKQFGYITGTIHALPELTAERPPQPRDVDDFLFLVDAMGQKGIRILAHPLRIFRRAGWEAPVELFEPTAKLLQQHDVAAEVNFHSNEPPLGFVRCCLDQGVKFSFGSDAHNLAEIGDFAYQIDLLRKAGYDGDLGDILIDKQN